MVAVLDEDREIVNRLAAEHARSKTAIKATSKCDAIYDTLRKYLGVVVANTQQTKTIGIAEVNNYRVDPYGNATSPSRYPRRKLRSDGENPGAEHICAMPENG